MKRTFLGLDQSTPDTAEATILPIPYQRTVSYGVGTDRGPEALLTASEQVELFDCELGRSIAAARFFTAPAWQDTAEAPLEEAVASIRSYAEHWSSPEALLVGLGGEHTVTFPLLELLSARVGPMTVVQIDAHADLRDSYQDTKLSHACVARRALDAGHKLVQVGIRAVSREEFELIEDSEAITTFWAKQIRCDSDWFGRLRDRVDSIEGPVYLTFVVDGLDPSILPGTGTPVPGGLTYQQALDVIDLVATGSEVVGLDVVELAPIAGQQVSEFVAAKLLVRALSQVLSRRAA